MILTQNVSKAVRATVISGLNDLVSATEHPIANSRFLPKVHLASLIADLRDGQSVQCCTYILGCQTTYNPVNEDLVNGKESIAVYQVIG